MNVPPPPNVTELEAVSLRQLYYLNFKARDSHTQHLVDEANTDRCVLFAEIARLNLLLAERQS